MWTQVYNPTGGEWVSTLLAAAPITVLLGTLGLLGWSAPKAAAAGLIMALAVSIGVYGMPWQSAAAASVYGACFGMFPIGWIVFGAVFLYVLTVEMGEFEKVKYSVAALSADRRVQALLIAFSFGAFLEGAAGFGTPVAISSALLIGAGFPPLYAAGLSLLANTAPVAFGALGTPIVTLADITHLDVRALSAMAGRQLPLFALMVPAWMVVVMSGWRGLAGVWPAVAVCGGVFAIVQFVTSNFLGPTLVDVAGGLSSLAALAILLRFWQPRQVWQFREATSASTPSRGLAVDSVLAAPAAIIPPPPDAGPKSTAPFTRRQIAYAWVPWLILSICVFIWGLPQFRNWLDQFSDFKFQVPFLHNRIQPDVGAIGGEAKPLVAEFRLNWLSATGTGIFVASILSSLWMGTSAYRFLWALLGTFHRLRWSLFTIACMLAIAYLTKYSGTDVTLGLAFTHTGVLYPFFAAMLGWLGVALTGSDTSSNALFGNLQRITALRLGLNPVLICAANSTGGVMGKMIDAQSIVVASAATGQQGEEGRILRFVFWHSLALAALVGALTMIQAYLLPGMVPR